jgi:hypothetical protein
MRRTWLYFEKAVQHRCSAVQDAVLCHTMLTLCVRCCAVLCCICCAVLCTAPAVLITITMLCCVEPGLVWSVRYSAALCAVLCSEVHCSAVQCSTVLCGAALCCAVLWRCCASLSAVQMVQWLVCPQKATHTTYVGTVSNIMGCCCTCGRVDDRHSWRRKCGKFSGTRCLTFSSTSWSRRPGGSVKHPMPPTRLCLLWLCSTLEDSLQWKPAALILTHVEGGTWCGAE